MGKFNDWKQLMDEEDEDKLVPLKPRKPFRPDPVKEQMKRDLKNKVSKFRKERD